MGCDSKCVYVMRNEAGVVFIQAGVSYVQVYVRKPRMSQQRIILSRGISTYLVTCSYRHDSSGVRRKALMSFTALLKGVQSTLKPQQPGTTHRGQLKNNRTQESTVYDIYIL